MLKIIIFCLLVGTLILCIPSWTYSYQKPPEAPLPTVKEYAEQMVLKTFGEGHWASFDAIVMKESRWNHLAKNPRSSAFGIGQMLTSTWGSVGCVKTSDPYVQVDCMGKYIKARYKTPALALKYHLVHNYY